MLALTIIICHSITLTQTAKCVNSTIKVYACCPSEYQHSCCNEISNCIGSNANLKNVTKCTDEHDFGCLAGFYKYNNTELRCPKGFYCPNKRNCIIPCTKGAYCPGSILTIPDNKTITDCINSGSCCHMLGKVSKSKLINGTLLCPGMTYDMECPKFSYCPNTVTKIKCLKGSYCPSGSTKELRCSSFSNCTFGAENGADWTGIIILIILLLLLFFYVAYRYKQLACLGNISTKAKINATNKKVTINTVLRDIASNDFSKNRKCLTEKEIKMDIGFSNLTLQLKDRKILSNTYGSFKHGELTAVMGPSGCGKTTLLNVLMGKYHGKLTGNITINKQKVENMKDYKRSIGFSPQDDIMHRLLTPREVLTYQAKLRLSSDYDDRIITDSITELLVILGLSSISDDVIGDEETRGISGGQRKRVNIGMELAADPSVLFLDEPTSGLDSSTSLEILRLLREIAEQINLTIVCVIHQPRYEVFTMFHKVLLLGENGKVFYQGKVNETQNYFQALGYEFPAMCNPADFILDVVNGTSVSALCNKSDLPEIWKEKCAITDIATEDEIAFNVANEVFDSNHNDLETKVIIASNMLFEQRSWFRQLWHCYHRAILLQIRALNVLFVEIIVCVIIGGILGAIYSNASIGVMISKGAFMALCLGMLSMLPSLKYFGNNVSILRRERNTGINLFSYFLAINLLTLPILLIIYPLSYLSMLYTFSNIRATFWETYGNIACAMFATSGIGYMISTAMSSKKSQMVTIGVVLISSMCGGSNISLCELKKIPVVGPILYSVSYARWFMEAQFEVEAQQYSDILMNIVREYGNTNVYGLENRSLCIGVLICFGIVSRILAFLFLFLTGK